MRLCPAVAVLLVLTSSGCAPAPTPRAAPDAPAPQVAPPPREVATPTEAEIRELIRCSLRHCAFDNVDQARQALAKLGPRVFPACHAILADPASSDRMVVGACGTVIAVENADRRRFVPLAVKRFTAKDGFHVPEDPPPPSGDDLARRQAWARVPAIRLLGAIGDGRDAPALVPLLSDAACVRYAAADALARIGGRAELAALDACLKPGDPRRDDNEARYLAECRDRLAKRLSEVPAGD